MTPFGEKSYRQGALERLEESRRLLQIEQFAGAVYLGGRSVEGMFRAVIWKHDPEIQQGKKSLDTGHNLRDLLTLVRNLALIPAGRRDHEFVAAVQHVGRLWFNNLRFASSNYVKYHWFELGEIGGKRTLKRAVADYFNSCSLVVKRREALCQY